MACHLWVLAILGRITVLLAMSHTGVMDNATAQGYLRDMMSAVEKPPRPKRGVIGSRQSNQCGVIVNQGRIVFEYARMMMGDEEVNRVVTDGHQLRLHRGFWPACTSHCFHRTCTGTLRKQLAKSLQHYIFSLRKGATTAQGMLGDKNATQKRSLEGAKNSLKCPELGQLLYDWFIDCLQLYNARLHQPLFLERARFLLQRLLDRGYEPHQMPNLAYEAGKSWFRRWRKRFRVVARKTVKHLKVSWAKLKMRVRVYLKGSA